MEMKYFDLIKPGTNHDFVKYRTVAVIGSLIVNALVLLGVFFWPGLHYGVDFAFKQTVDEEALRAVVEKLGTPVKEIRPLLAREGKDREYTVITQGTGD